MARVIGKVITATKIFFDSGYFNPNLGSGAATFLELTDTPSSYTSQANKYVKVNAGATALEFITLAGGGDMVAATYDPTNVADDAFDVDNHVDGTTNKVFTATEKTKLAGIETGAEANNISDANATDLTDAGNTTLHIHDSRYYTEAEADALLADKANNTEVFHNNVANEFGGLVEKTAVHRDDLILVEDSEDSFNKVYARFDNLPTTSAVNTALTGKQATLVSGMNIKTVGTVSLLGSGNVSIFPKGHIWGLVLSFATTSTITIAVGQAADENGSGDMVLAGAITKSLASGWAVGTGNGGLNTGAEANSTWYEVHLIKRVDTGVVDVMFTTTANRATLPANYTLQRRIGWIFNGSGGDIKDFSQRGNHFTWITQVNDGAFTAATVAAQITLTVPPHSIARFRACILGNTNVNGPVLTVFSEIIEGNVTPASTTGIASVGAGDFAIVGAGHFELRVDANRQIEHDSNTTTGSAEVDVSTFGWIDEREQYGNY